MMMAEKLIGLGHSKIGVIGAPEHSLPVQFRLQGVIVRLKQSGLKPTNVVLGPAHDIDACLALATQVLAADTKPTAIIGTTDIAAIGAVHAAIGLGLHVPSDLSVIGFDDLPAARYVLPALTTVAQPLREIGTLAVAQLCSLMAGQKIELPSRDAFALQLVLRGSTASPKT